MTVLKEGNLQITINNAIDVRRKLSHCMTMSEHGLSHCMKAVDFVVELPDRYLFIEVKDPQDPQAPSEAGEQFIQRFQSGQIDEEFKYKYRDSFLYEWASGRADKQVYFTILVLIALDSLTAPLLLNRKRDGTGTQRLPLRGLPASGASVASVRLSMTAMCSI